MKNTKRRLSFLLAAALIFSVGAAELFPTAAHVECVVLMSRVEK